MRIVQMHDDLERTEPDVLIGQLIVDAAEERAVIAREERETRGGGAQPGPTVRVAGEPPDGLRWIRRLYMNFHPGSSLDLLILTQL